MKRIKLTIQNNVGLHARPATLFVKNAAALESDIFIRNLTKATDWVNAKSILHILSIGVEQGHEIEIQAEGKDEDKALASLESLVISNFQNI